MPCFTVHILCCWKLRKAFDTVSHNKEFHITNFTELYINKLPTISSYTYVGVLIVITMYQVDCVSTTLHSASYQYSCCMYTAIASYCIPAVLALCRESQRV